VPSARWSVVSVAPPPDQHVGAFVLRQVHRIHLPSPDPLNQAITLNPRQHGVPPDRQIANCSSARSLFFQRGNAWVSFTTETWHSACERIHVNADAVYVAQSAFIPQDGITCGHKQTRPLTPPIHLQGAGVPSLTVSQAIHRLNTALRPGKIGALPVNTFPVPREGGEARLP